MTILKQFNFGQIPEKKAPTNNVQQQVSQQIQQHIQSSYHTKKASITFENNFEINSYELKTLPSQAMFAGDIKTNLLPEEIVYIMKQYEIENPSFTCKDLHQNHKYEINHNLKVQELVYNEEIDDLEEVEVEHLIKYTIQIIKVSDLDERYTLSFQNLVRDYQMEYMNCRVNLLNYIKQF